MGVGYYRPVSQWSKGEYDGATNTEDDLARIPENGAPLLPDDHGDAAAGATDLGAGATLGGSGTITSDADVDAFRFRSAGGAATIAVTPAVVGPNLDIDMELRSADGVLVARSNPVYEGGANHLGSTSPPLAQTVGLNPSVVQLSSSAQPSVVGQTVVYRAAVAPQGACL